MSPISIEKTSSVKPFADLKAGVKAVTDVTVGTTLMVFVVDTSMPGGGRRIAAVQGAISSLLPKTRVAIVSCFGNEAEVTLQPTSSFISASGKLQTMKKSVMGNLGAGLELALKTSEDALLNKYADRVVMAILADGKAHGLLTGTSDCETEVVDLCDLELMTSATDIQLKTKELNAAGLRLSSVIVDTEFKNLAGAEWSEEGARLASVTGSDYYHSPTLTDTELLRYANQYF
jgi:Mg-chelatase subunit ChlD